VPKPSIASALRARLELADRFVVCYSGNLGKAHEFDTLLSAASALRANLSIVFLIIGGGTKMAPLQRAVAALSLENFRFLPYQPREELEDSLAAADLHLVSLLPTLEGLILPSKLYGILAAGRPLVFIGDPKGDIARVVSDAECGAIVEINAGEALAAAILRLQADPAACEAMGTRARESLVNRYSMEKGIERWLALLDAKPQSRGGAVQPPSLSGQ
jgi:glycosyltransferase involved in cell wall biosynthesis